MRKLFALFFSICAFVMPALAGEKEVHDVRVLLEREMRNSPQLLEAVSFVSVGSTIYSLTATSKELRQVLVHQAVHNEKARRLGNQTVVIANGVRYTIYSPEMQAERTGKECWVSIWFRKDGTKDRNNLSYVNANCDGIVKAGQHGMLPYPNRGEKYLDKEGAASLGIAPSGFEHEAYWQTKFDEIIALVTPVLQKHAQ